MPMNYLSTCLEVPASHGRARTQKYVAASARAPLAHSQRVVLRPVRPISLAVKDFSVVQQNLLPLVLRRHARYVLVLVTIIPLLPKQMEHSGHGVVTMPGSLD